MMLEILAYANARMGESGTWAAIAAMLTALHVNVPPGVWSQVTAWAVIASGVLSVILKEAQSGTSKSQIEADAFAALLKALQQGTSNNANPSSGSAASGSV